VHIEKYEIEAGQTSWPKSHQGNPTVLRKSLATLDEMGINRIGAYVESGDILVWQRWTPKGESDQHLRRKLLRATLARSP